MFLKVFLWHTFWQVPWSSSSVHAAGVSPAATVFMNIFAAILMLVLPFVWVGVSNLCFNIDGCIKLQDRITPRMWLLWSTLIALMWFYPHSALLLAVLLGLPVLALVALIWIVCVIISNDVEKPWTPQAGIDAWKQAKQAKADNRSLSRSYASDENLSNRSLSQV